MQICLLVISAVMLSACASPLPPAFNISGPFADGRKLAQTHCAACHAIGRSDRGPHPEAPPFRRLSDNYPIDALAESFAEGIVVGHPDMPEFTLQPDAINALLGYIRSVQDNAHPG